MEIYIYTLEHPITNEVRYVGKTINIKRRYKQHLYEKRPSHKASWIKSLRKENLKPIIKIIEICTIDNWIDREIYWISVFDNLTNIRSGGGTNIVHTTKDETRKKLSEAHKGRVFNEAHKGKIKESTKNKKPCLIDGVEYESTSEASKIFNVNQTTIVRRIKSNNFPTYKFK